MGLNRDEKINTVPQHQSAGYSDRLSFKTVVATTDALSGATATLTNLIPAGSLVLGVVCEVTTAITGATTFKVGDGSDDDRWGALVAIAAGSKSSSANFTGTQPAFFGSANSVVLTANGSNFTAGVVRVIVHYLSVAA